ncbi:alpha-2B adrenergic receptor [Protopterus annectens]|uniref:alpha-2B adrenergic receptor n=1 Tax=Protopterus annectens TaxID=7888 RepID=UPI001CF9D546|nr:alpha-2B adrenergic receptor [Protopterus annectens]
MSATNFSPELTQDYINYSVCVVQNGWKLPYAPQAAAVIATVVVFLILFTIFGNVLVIIAVLTSRALKAPQNLFLVSLAAADILVGTLIIPFSLSKELMGCWYFKDIWCEIFLALDVLFCTSSIVHLCAISLDRYWSVSRPIEYNSKRTPKRIKCTILIVWLIAAFISFPPLISMNKTGTGTEKEQSAIQCHLNDERWYVLSSSICSFFAPCVIMILVYLRIYQIAKRRSRRHSANREMQGTSHDPNKEVQDSPCAELSYQPQHGIPSGKNCHQTCSHLGVHQPCGVSERTELTALNDQQKGGTDSCITPGQDYTDPKELGLMNNGKSQECIRFVDTVATSQGDYVKTERLPTQYPLKKKAVWNRETRFTFVLAVVIGVFVLCWFPFFFCYSLTAICPETCTVHKDVFNFFFWIGYCNSSLNPVIYTIFNQDFRKAFKKILCKVRTPTPF